MRTPLAAAMLLAASFVLPYSRKEPISLVFTLLRRSKLSCSLRREFHLEVCAGRDEGPGEGGAPGLGPTSRSALGINYASSLNEASLLWQTSWLPRGLPQSVCPCLLGYQQQLVGSDYRPRMLLDDANLPSGGIRAAHQQPWQQRSIHFDADLRKSIDTTRER